MAKVGRIGTEWGVWAAAVLAVWLLTLSSVSGADLIVACPAAALCAVVAVTVRRVLGVHLQPSRRLGRWAASLPYALVRDTAVVLALPWRRGFAPGTEGDWQRVPVAPGPDRHAETIRAAASLFVSLTPGSFVVHDDSDSGELLTHVLVAGRGSTTEAVQR